MCITEKSLANKNNLFSFQIMKELLVNCKICMYMPLMESTHIFYQKNCICTLHGLFILIEVRPPAIKSIESVVKQLLFLCYWQTMLKEHFERT